MKLCHSSSCIGFQVQSFDWVKGFFFLPFKFKVRSTARVFRGVSNRVPLSILGVGQSLSLMVLAFSVPFERLPVVSSLKSGMVWFFFRCLVRMDIL